MDGFKVQVNARAAKLAHRMDSHQSATSLQLFRPPIGDGGNDSEPGHVALRADWEESQARLMATFLGAQLGNPTADLDRPASL